MGKLTDSLKATTDQLGALKQGIAQVQTLGQDLAENAAAIAEAGLRTGYAYAKAEETVAQGCGPEPQQASLPAPPWTLADLKAAFKTMQEAYAYLKAETGIKLRSPSWQTVLEAFQEQGLPGPGANGVGVAGGLSSSSPPSLVELGLRVAQLEAIVSAQAAQLHRQSEQLAALQALIQR